MQGVVVPNVYFEACLYSSVICPYPLLQSVDQFINHRLHEHTHITPRVSRNYQRQEYVMPLKGDAGREIEGDNKKQASMCMGQPSFHKN
jgi:hypothetical protein